MTTEANKDAARLLAGQAHDVGRADLQEPARGLLQRLSRGLLGWREEPHHAELDTPWQDAPSPLRSGWRERAANLNGEDVFSVDYWVCSECRLAWVEEPYTTPEYQGCGLASAGLAALRDEFGNVSWHTLGGHLRDAKAFWIAVGSGVAGGYQKRELCPHVDLG
ncbi:hypothetical protein ACFQ9Q_09285 [Streptomyces virginiae]|uniref:hypothetical protein n=1 Tax=Streptomyces virginiae TaxID=1961 RepID=UPI0007C4E3A2|nr:hypothetical protein [Streptomyces virginiae]